MHVTNCKELQLAKFELEQKEAIQKNELVSQFYHTAESLKPVNLITAALNNLTESGPAASANISDATIGIAIGGLVEKIAVGKDPGPLRKTIGSVLSLVVTGIAIKNAEQIKTACSKLLKQAVSFFEGFNRSH
jgi:hypothetical protein